MPAQYLHTSGAVTRLQNNHTGRATYCLNKLYMFWVTEGLCRSVCLRLTFRDSSALQRPETISLVAGSPLADYFG